jgi:hypothetical protein
MTDKLQQLDKVPDKQVTALEDKLKSLTQSKEWEIAQGAVDAAGIVDPTPISDGISAVMSLAKGDWVGAGLSAVSMIPYLGDAVAKTAKGARAIKKLKELAESIKTTAKALEDARAARNIANRKAAAKAAQDARKEAANACKKCDPEVQKFGTQLPTRGTWDPPGSRGDGKWTSEGGDYKVEYKNGYPDFSTATGKDGLPITIDSVEIPAMKGNTGSDMTAARDAMRIKENKPDWPGPGIKATEPPGYVWHHKEDGATMELLPVDLHNKSMSAGGSGAAHTGGASIVKDKTF